jgi:hypothetical protein
MDRRDCGTSLLILAIETILTVHRGNEMSLSGLDLGMICPLATATNHHPGI